MDRQAREECKNALARIRDFVLYGTPLDEFTSALVQGDYRRAGEITPSPIRARDALPDLIEWVTDHIPQGRFTGADSIAQWRAHDGLSAAGDTERMWFYMLSPYWSPKRLGDKLKANQIHA